MIVNIGVEAYVSTLNDGSIILRTARKTHNCWGGHNGQERVPCRVTIELESQYIEYLGESDPYQSGKRYHLRCAVQQGLLRKFEKGNGPTTTAEAEGR